MKKAEICKKASCGDIFRTLSNIYDEAFPGEYNCYNC